MKFEKFEDLNAVLLKIRVCRFVKPSQLANSYRSYYGSYCSPRRIDLEPEDENHPSINRQSPIDTE